MKATLAFNSIIKEFDDKTVVNDLLKQLSDAEKEYWRKLLYDQSVLFRAELQESLQFSYHTIKTLTRLNTAKREKRLIKEALAYRDMRRFDEALKVIRELLWGSKESENAGTTLKVIFDRFEHWKCKNKKAGISSEIAGLLFDFYLAKFEDEDPDKDDVDTLTEKMKEYSVFLMKSKPERTSYLSQVAMYLRWLSDKHEEKLKQIDALYPRFRKDINLDKLDKTLKDFDIYNYDRFVDSLEKFYRNCNTPNVSWTRNMKRDERNFLVKVKLFEKEKFYLYDFKELERNQRIQTLDNGRMKKCLTPSPCFDGKDDRFFYGLLHCNGTNTKQKGKSAQTREFSTDEVKELKDHDYETIMKKENENFLEYLKYKSSHPTPKAVSPEKKNPCSYHFMGLQRWNSQTPTLTLSKGGGYLLYKQDKEGAVEFGMAIDPGFNFVDNLFHMGFTLKDIDFILLTHAHLDHIRDFEPIVSALLDLKKRQPEERKVKGKIHAIMSLGVYRKLENIITNTVLREFLADTYIVDIEREIVDREKDGYLSPIRFLNQNGSLVSILDDKDDNFQVKIIPTRAYHDDNSERSDSFGYIINVKDEDCNFSFGYTGDTRWHEEDVCSQYSQCDVVCIHLGALIESEDEKNEKNKFSYYSGPHCEELIEKKWHPYLFGLLRWIKAIKMSKNNKNGLILLSEFGEELKGGIRIDLIRRLNKMFSDKKQRVCIPVDIGLNVVLGRNRSSANPYQVWCSGCESFVNATDIRYRHFGYGRGDEALFYFCETCLKSRPTNILRDKMRHICELGIPLRKWTAPPGMDKMC